jgi:hypothetical protein
MRFPFLVCMSLPPLGLLLVLLLPLLPTVMMKFPFRVSHTILLWFRVLVLLRFLSRTPVFLAFLLHLPSYWSPLTCPGGMAAVADAPSGMVNTDMLFLLVLFDRDDEVLIPHPSCSHVPSTSCPSALNLPRRLVAVADAYVGMDHVHLLLLLLPNVQSIPHESYHTLMLPTTKPTGWRNRSASLLQNLAHCSSYCSLIMRYRAGLAQAIGRNRQSASNGRHHFFAQPAPPLRTREPLCS